MINVEVLFCLRWFMLRFYFVYWLMLMFYFVSVVIVEVLLCFGG